MIPTGRVIIFIGYIIGIQNTSKMGVFITLNYQFPVKVFHKSFPIIF